MPTQALAAYGIQLRLGDGVSPGGVSVTAASNASPIVLTTTTHGLVDVSIVTVSGVLGNTAANGTWVVHVPDSTHLVLRSSTGNGTYTGGGGVTVLSSFAVVAELTNLQDAGVVATLQETSAHDGNGWASRVPTLLSGNAVRLSLNLVPAHATHNPTTGLEYLLLNRVKRWYMIVFPDANKSVWAFMGYVTSHRVQGPVAGILTADTMITFTDTAYLTAA
jgi:hypothetical protein